MKKLLLPLLVLAAIAAGFLLLRHSPAPTDRQPAAGTEPAPKTTGVYADDWASQCGPLQGAEQARCTDRLDIAYGRKAGVPVGK